MTRRITNRNARDDGVTPIQSYNRVARAEVDTAATTWYPEHIEAHSCPQEK